MYDVDNHISSTQPSKSVNKFSSFQSIWSGSCGYSSGGRLHCRSPHGDGWLLWKWSLVVVVVVIVVGVKEVAVKVIVTVLGPIVAMVGIVVGVTLVMVVMGVGYILVGCNDFWSCSRLVIIYSGGDGCDGSEHLWKKRRQK